MASEYSVRTAASSAEAAWQPATASNGVIPSRGSRIEFLRSGIWVRGTVSSVDEEHVLLELGAGQRVSLRQGHDPYRVVGFH